MLPVGIDDGHHDIHIAPEGLAEDELTRVGRHSEDVGFARRQLPGFPSTSGQLRNILRRRGAEAAGEEEEREQQKSGFRVSVLPAKGCSWAPRSRAPGPEKPEDFVGAEAACRPQSHVSPSS